MLNWKLDAPRKVTSSNIYIIYILERQLSRGRYNNPAAKDGDYLEDHRRQYNNPHGNNHFLEDHWRRYKNNRVNNYGTNNPRANNHFLEDRGRRRYKNTNRGSRNIYSNQ